MKSTGLAYPGRWCWRIHSKRLETGIFGKRKEAGWQVMGHFWCASWRYPGIGKGTDTKGVARVSKVKPQVYAGMFPVSADDYEDFQMQ